VPRGDAALRKLGPDGPAAACHRGGPPRLRVGADRDRLPVRLIGVSAAIPLRRPCPRTNVTQQQEEGMLRSIDHIVILVRDLAQRPGASERLGFPATPGGEHTGGATHNALITFADGAYFELIAFKERDKEQPHRWWRQLAYGEGIVDYCLRGDDVGSEAA